MRLEVEYARRVELDIHCQVANGSLKENRVPKLWCVAIPIPCILKDLREPNAPA